MKQNRIFHRLYYLVGKGRKAQLSFYALKAAINAIMLRLVEYLFFTISLDFANKRIEFSVNFINFLIKLLFGWKNEFHRVKEPIDVRLR